MKKHKRIIIFIEMLLLCSSNIFLNRGISANAENTRKYLGESVYAGKSDGYSKKQMIDKNDPHYGWNIGEFFISGFTRVNEDSNEPILLKNVGDKVKLSFKLLQNIDRLNNDEKLVIGSDDDGYDEYFGIKKTDFGRGMLIVQKTDYQGHKEEPVLYKNYLQGKALNADTEVGLYEEGDYEVALDYEISIDKAWHDYITIWNQYTYDYRIFFKFSVRNGNCMVYPFDVVTKAELSDTSITENGFSLNFAKSRYLEVDIKKQILNEGATGLVEDTRFNKPAADGEKYTDEGIYIITAKNKYTKQKTEKTIYVGDNDLLKAYATTKLPLEEIQSQINNGAIVNRDGTMKYVVANDDTTNVIHEDSKKTEKTGGGNKEVLPENKSHIKSSKKLIYVLIVVSFLVLVISIKRRGKKKALQKEKLLQDKELINRMEYRDDETDKENVAYGGTGNEGDNE